MFRVPVLAAAAIACALLANPSGDGPAYAAGLSCDAKTVKRGGATLIEGFVTAAPGTVGRYRISVTSGGGDTDQSGEFSGSGNRFSLGVVPVAGTGPYRAEITIRSNNGLQCTGQTSGRI